MPNHITNRVTISGSQAILDQFITEDDEGYRFFDFNKIIPMPKQLQGGVSEAGAKTRAEMALGLLPEYDSDNILTAMKYDTAYRNLNKEIRKEDINQVIEYLQNYRDTGHTDWYEWSIANWDTKWNSYSLKEEQDYIEFDTAWSMPNNIFISLSNMLPDVIIRVEYADEDIGSNCGVVEYLNGERYHENVAPKYNEQTVAEQTYWRKFAFNLNNPNDDPKEWGFDPETFEYIEEEDEE